MRSLILALLCIVTPARAEDSPPLQNDVELAKAHFNTGQIYYDRGRFHDAAREFEEAYRLYPRAPLLYNMGKAYDGAGDHARALAAYRRFLDAVKQSPDRAEVIDRVKHLTDLVGRVRILADVDGSQVTIDGQPAGTTPIMRDIELNPGAHHIEIVHEGYATWRRDVVAGPGAPEDIHAEQNSLVKIVRVEVRTPEKKVPLYKRWWLWTAVGVVVAGAVVGGAVAASQQPPVSGPFATLPGVR
jgi:tetratricopeptide (TPR) repeat protein